MLLWPLCVVGSLHHSPGSMLQYGKLSEAVSFIEVLSYESMMYQSTMKCKFTHTCHAGANVSSHLSMTSSNTIRAASQHARSDLASSSSCLPAYNSCMAATDAVTCGQILYCAWTSQFHSQTASTASSSSSSTTAATTSHLGTAVERCVLQVSNHPCTSAQDAATCSMITDQAGHRICTAQVSQAEAALTRCCSMSLCIHLVNGDMLPCVKASCGHMAWA